MSEHKPRHLRVVAEPETFPFPVPFGMEPETAEPKTAPPTLKPVPEHRVRIRLQYLDYSETGGGRASENRTDVPWKWRADCTCGWGCLSWSWSRQYDMERSNLSPEQWVEDNDQPTGGALVIALEHLAEKAAPQAAQTARASQ